MSEAYRPALPFALQQLQTQISTFVLPYFEQARKQHNSMQVVLYIDEEGKVCEPKITVKGNRVANK